MRAAGLTEIPGAKPISTSAQFQPGVAVWVVIGVVAVVVFTLRDDHAWLLKYPKQYIVPLSQWLDATMAWMIEHGRWLFRAIAWVLDQALVYVRVVLSWLPWPVIIGAFLLLSYYSGGLRLTVLTFASLVYMLIVGYWDKAMLTLSLVCLSVPLSVIVGLIVGVVAFQYRVVRRVVEPALDVMQAMPAFAYLIPVLLLFGVTPMVAIITSAIYAIPPITRAVLLGYTRVPIEVVESARMAGATNWQMLWWVRFPSSRPTLLLGLNQTIMAAFALVVFAALVGGSDDIGYEVLRRLRKSQFGESLLAGLVITLFAILADRISRGYAVRTAQVEHAGNKSGAPWRIIAVALAVVAIGVLAEFVPALRSFPSDWVFYPADALSDSVKWFTATFFDATSWIKEKVLFFFLLPLHIGMEKAVRPHVWGFELTATISWVYAGLLVIGAGLAARRWSWRPAVAIGILGGLYHFGTQGTPWPVVILVVTALGWQTGGWKVGVGAFLGLVFIVLTGFWRPAMTSVYLCAAAVVVCLVVGGLLGVLASQSDRVSAFLRPINDTLQTIPLFVFLIPVLMVFQHGDFAAVLAIVMYAIVPAIRYTEHGIRNVPADIVEAARALGCTKGQLLRLVQLPLALPEIMLGLNQVVVFALAMLIVTALLGTQDLGHKIYQALARLELGNGLVAGLGIAFIAMIADRIIQALSARWKQNLGLE